jgi:hypothetical protein
LGAASASEEEGNDAIPWDAHDTPWFHVDLHGVLHEDTVQYVLTTLRMKLI